jgi:cyanophycin synthetase
MKIVDSHFLRGPNIHSDGRCFIAILDLEELEDRPSTSFAAFTERLCAALPTLKEHRCSRGHEGGFIERLREGTYMAHVVEHVLIELQCLAGTPVGFGRARAITSKPGHYRVVCAYELECVVSATLPIAVEAVNALCRGEALDLAAGIEALRERAVDAALGPSTRAIVAAAERRGIPCLRLSEESSMVQLGWGVHQKRVQATLTSNTNEIAINIAADKHLAKALLREAGVPVPNGEVVESVEEALAAFHRLGGAVVVKPLDANHGKGVSVGLETGDQVRAGFERARDFRSRVIVERFLEGYDHRVLVVQGAVLAAARRSPPAVTGDGRRTVRELIESENANPLRGEGHCAPLTRIPIDDAACDMLARQGLQIDAIAPRGMAVRLRGNANLSSGATAQDVTERMHPDVAAACVRAARKVGLDVAGVDVVCRDIERPLEEQGGGVVEVNAAPGIRMHEHPSLGECHRVGEAILQTLYPPGHNGRIPVVAVTGTNGKTTTALLIADAFEGAGRITGVATTEFIRINGQVVRRGDCTGYWSARTVLTAPEVEVAVLETARGGILRRGLGFDRCEVAVVLNVEDDHVGQDYVQSLDELARAKRVVAEAASRAVVLNAADARCVAMAPYVDEEARIIYFAMNDSNRVLLDHLERGASAVYLRHGMIMMAVGEHRVPLIEADRLGFALHGLAHHNVANALAATAALWACGLDRAVMVARLAAFTCSVERNPLRMNLFTARGVDILLDYAHNAASYRALIGTARRLRPRRLVGVVAAPGDRRDDKLREIGAVCGTGFDEIVVYDMDDLRGRRPGDSAGHIVRGALEAGARRDEVHTVLDVRSAASLALRHCSPGDLLVLGCACSIDDLIGGIPEAEEVPDFASLGAPWDAPTPAGPVRPH